MRLFVAIDLKAAIRERIRRFMDELRALAPDAKWVAPESLHVTLKFIGEQPEEELQAIMRALATVPAGSFKLEFRGLGFFPSPKSARVFWVGIEAGERLAELARKVDEVIARFGVPEEERYSPHLTLARARPARPGSRRPAGERPQAAGSPFARLQQKLQTAPEPSFGTMTAREFFLYESKLSPKGPCYTKVARFELE
jgi:2'-5' RNA ligase